MALTLEQLQAAFKKNDNNNDNENRPNNYYPFWNMKDDEKAVVRFLPDKNPDNPMGFLVEKLMHNLEINGETKRVPCLKMYGDDDCPICAVSRAYYKDEGKKSVNGKKYWRKKQHIAQALIVSDPLEADKDTGETHEGKVRFLNLGWQIYEKIKAEFEGGELESIPYMFEDGCNFNIGKSAQGEYSTYAITSGFARRSSSLTEDEIARVEDEMVDLSTLLPAKPSLEKVEAMLAAALSGTEYVDPDGDSSNDDAGDEPAPKAAPKVAETKPAPKAEAKAAPAEAPSEDEAAADDILAKIRQRRAAQAE